MSDKIFGLSYAITVHNEIDELKLLVDLLMTHKFDDDEIVIQMDSKATPEVREYLDKLKDKIIVVEFGLDDNFANFKNNLNKHCTKKWIFQIDSDELVQESLLSTLREILEVNEDKDVILVPRINTVEGMTPADVKQYGWQVNPQGWVNFPDYQFRIQKNVDYINWVGSVHETLSGFKNLSRLPPDEDYCLLHPKTIERQRKQNEYYINTFNK